METSIVWGFYLQKQLFGPTFRIGPVTLQHTASHILGLLKAEMPYGPYGCIGMSRKTPVRHCRVCCLHLAEGSLDEWDLYMHSPSLAMLLQVLINSCDLVCCGM